MPFLVKGNSVAEINQVLRLIQTTTQTTAQPVITPVSVALIGSSGAAASSSTGGVSQLIYLVNQDGAGNISTNSDGNAVLIGQLVLVP